MTVAIFDRHVLPAPPALAPPQAIGLLVQSAAVRLSVATGVSLARAMREEFKPLSRRIPMWLLTGTRAFNS